MKQTRPATRYNLKSVSLVLCLTVITLFLTVDCTSSPSKNDREERMEKAVPVWAKGREKEMNLTLGFRGVFSIEEKREVSLRIAASTLYRVYLNGAFLGSGPARAGHGFFRVDSYDLSQKVTEGKNIVAIEVAGYNVNSFYTIDQPSFLQAEVALNGHVLLATGNNADFEAFVIKERVRKVERYSFQRPFTEYYRLQEGYDKWRTSEVSMVEKTTLAEYPAVFLLPRHLLLPDFSIVTPVAVYAKGKIQFSKPKDYIKDRSLVNINEKLKGYREEELEVSPSQRIQEMATASKEVLNDSVVPVPPLTMRKDDFYILDFGINQTGFIGAKVRCQTPSTLWFHFDEMLTGEDVASKKRMSGVNNQVVYELQPGEYDLETFEAYTLKFLKIMVTEGICTVETPYLREFAYPDHPKASFSCSNAKLNAIYDAAKQTFRQNAVDIFMDCPSRERAGWLCDSYFTAIMEKEFTGYSKIAYNFYENYALPEKFEALPQGMIPMCYPADHYDGVFIPNWSLWFIVQVDDYAKRGGDPLLVARLKDRIEGLLDYFEPFENEDGVLEKLQSWIFVEWSKANSWVQDVNYPTNMLYSAALAGAASLYGNPEWREKSERIRQQILQQSFNGTFFADNAVRENGILKVTSNMSEACQYYAFFFNIATPETHPELWKKLTEDFGPLRDEAHTFPEVAVANAFIGNYLRMDILSRYDRQAQLLSEIEDYFYYMAEKTGTLWENVHSQASCNHGFASYIGHLLYRDVLGISHIDYLKKEIVIRFSDIGLKHCQGSIPIGDEAVSLKWVRSDNRIRYHLEKPAHFRVKIINNSSADQCLPDTAL